MSGDAEMHQMLGALKATVEHLNATVQGMTVQWREQEQSASMGRRDLHQKFDALKQDVGDKLNAISLRVNAMDTKLVSVSPAIDEFRSQREQAKGAAHEQARLMRIGRGLWGAILAAVGATAGVAGWFLHGWGSPPH